MADYPVTSVPMFVNKGKPKPEFSWREHNIQRRARRERMAQYAIEKAERERVAAEEAAEEAAAKANEEALERLRAGSDNESSSASSVGYDIGDMGSPSPGAKARAEKKARDYAVFDRMGVTDEQLVGWRARMDAGLKAFQEERKDRPKPVEDPNDPYVIRRKKLEAQDAMIKRIAASTTPMFIRANTDIAFLQAAEAARQLERKTKGLPEPALTEAQLDPTWGSRRRGHPQWVQKILHPELFEHEDSPALDDNVIPKPDTLLPSIEVTTRPTTSTRAAAATSISAPFTRTLPHKDDRADIDIKGTAYVASNQVPSSQIRNYTDINKFNSPPASPEKNLESMWNGELDFTEESIEVSMSPQLQVRRFDRMREQEENNQSARQIASTQLERIRERNSEERALPADGVHNPKHSESPSEFKKNLQGNSLKPQQKTTTSNAPSQKSIEKDVEAATDDLDASYSTLDGKGVQIPNTPVTLYDARAYQRRHPPKSEEELRRIREDSYDALRQLSRSLSRSPDQPTTKKELPEDDLAQSDNDMASFATAREQDDKADATKPPSKPYNLEVAVKQEESSSTKVEADTLRPNRNDQTHSRPSSLSRSDADPEERITAEAKLFELQDNKSEKNSTRAPSPPTPDDDFEIIDETPKPKKQDPLTMPTPRVMGAFIETPAPTVRKSRSEDITSTTDRSTDEAKVEEHDPQTRGQPQAPILSTFPKPERIQQGIIRPRPPLINTAKKFSVADDIRRLKLEAGIDDSTDDFDSFLGKPVNIDEDEEDEPGSPVDELISGILKDKKLLDQGASGRTLSVKERERQLEQVIMERMNKHLKMTSSSLRDTRHGIERIEKQVSTTIAKPSTLQQADETVYFGLPVAHKTADDTIYIKLPVPRLWKYKPQKSGEQKFFSRNWKFTWLGLILALFATWFFAETVTCDIYCHPLVASKNTWHPDDPFFPYAIPTKLDQWTGQYASAGMYHALEYIEDLWTGQNKRGKRFRGVPRPTPTIMDIWWQGRSGPQGIMDHEPTRTHSMFADEVI